MATHLPLIGQAVVTDPGTTGTSYSLVAWSPAVSAEDQAHITRMPHVSDYLHLENSPRPFFSFHRLPGGAWGFIKRFAHDTRRGPYNRIVVYALVLPGEVMEALEWEPRLLPACIFRAAGQEWSFQDLSAWDGEVPQTLSDLEVVLPPDGTARRHELLEARRRFLEERWGRDGLERALAQALGVLEGGRGLLLPQGTEHEQLLALVCSVLPRRDRGTISWTTHLVPGSLDLFRLANAPDPDEVCANAGPSWSLLRESTRRPGSAAVAGALVTGTPPWPRLSSSWYELTERSGLSLVQDGVQVKRWGAWLARAGPPLEGFRSARDLEAYLAAHAIDRSSLADPWESPVALLALSARTAANLERSGHGAEVGRGVYNVLAGRGLGAAILIPQRFEELLDLRFDATILEAALGLCLRSVLSDQDKARLLVAALPLVRQVENTTLAGRVAARHLVPALAASPTIALLLGDHLDRALAALQTAPEGLSEALRTWRDTLYDRAVKELRRWLQEAPQAALEAAGSWDEDVAKERPSIVGLAELLAHQGIPAERWLPFVLAEAAALDKTGETASLVRFSANVSFPTAEVRQTAAAKLYQRLVREDLNPGAAHRALVLALTAELAARPEQAVAVFSSFSRLPESELRAWGVPIAAVAEALHQRGHRADASALGRNWLKQTAMIPWGGLPQEAINLVDLLSKADHGAVAAIWGPKILRITAPEEAVFSRFRDRLLTDPKWRRRFELSEVGAAMRAGRLPFSEGAERILALIPREERGDSLEELTAFLPRSANRKLQALFELVLSPGLSLSARRRVQEKLFWPALQKTDRSLFWVLPPVADLTGRGVILLRVLHRAGELWREDPSTCYNRLEEAIKLGRLDAVAAFLQGTASVQPSFLEVLASKNGDGRLLASLRRAAREPLAAWDLRPFLPHITGIA